MVKTAIHAGVWSTDLSPDNVARVLDSIAAIGFDCLAIPLRHPQNIRAAELGARFRSAGVGALGTAGLPAGSDIGSADSHERRRGEQHLLTTLAIASDIGISQINGVLYGPLAHASGPCDRDTMQRSAEVLAKVAAAAEEANIRLCVELVNRYETSMLNTVRQGQEFLRMVGHENLRLHLDTYHMAIEEADPVTAVREALPQLGYFELDQSHRGRLDEGALDLHTFSAPVREWGYQGFVGIEAFARSRLAGDHADALAIWRDHFDDANALARHALQLIHEIFGAPAARAPRNDRLVG